MPDYRLYLLDPRSGHIEGVEQFHTADDGEAICLVQDRRDGIPTELWCAGRKVARFDGRLETPPGAAGSRRPPARAMP
ncbi:MAG: hypothetical protein QOD42_41 [Sphingomonadales bacterium]|nr:hypothetical protein [Sphingomonadales bacterium]